MNYKIMLQISDILPTETTEQALSIMDTPYKG